MAYDPIKAHEYYEKYVKKGIKKGRKKGSSDTKKKGSKKKGSAKAAKKASLVGVSTSGLNGAGKIEAALVREKITKEMNDALAKETTDEGKEKVRREYSLKAQAEMDKLKKDPKYAQPTKTKKEGSSKSGSSKSSKSDSAKSESTNTNKGIVSVRATQPRQSSGGKGVSVNHTKVSTGNKTLTQQEISERQNMVNNVNDLISDIRDRIGNMTVEERKAAKKKVQDAVKAVRDRIREMNKG